MAQLASAQLAEPDAGAAESAEAEALLGAIGEASAALQRARSPELEPEPEAEAEAEPGP